MPETTTRLDRARVRELMALVLAARDAHLPDDESVTRREIGFRSLDFSELALRVEDEIDRELNFDAPGLRRVATPVAEGPPRDASSPGAKEPRGRAGLSQFVFAWYGGKASSTGPRPNQNLPSAP